MMRRSGIPGRHRRRRAPAKGFTLVELMVAMLILTVGLIGLASTAGVVMRLMSGAARQTIAANVAQTRFELLRNHLCSALSGGTDTTRNVTERWTTSVRGSVMALVEDSVTFTIASGQKPAVRVYQSYVPCQ